MMQRFKALICSCQDQSGKIKIAYLIVSNCIYQRLEEWFQQIDIPFTVIAMVHQGSELKMVNYNRTLSSTVA